MNWLDFTCLGGFALLISIAYAQGLILEVTQTIAIFLGGIVGFRGYRGLASSLHESLFTGWTIGFLNKLCLFMLFGGVFITIYSLGLTLERRAKEEHMIEKLTDRRLGAVFGMFKSVWVVCLVLGLFFYMGMVPERRVKETRRGPIVSMFLSVRPLAAPTVYIMAPSDLAKDYVNIGLKGKKKKKKRKKKKRKKR